MPVIPGRTACLRCIYPDPPAGVQPTCETAGILNAIVSAVASLQVADALKILSGHRDLVCARLTTIDVWDGGIRQIEGPPRDPECPTCARREFPYLEESPRPPASLCGRNAVQIHQRQRPIDLVALKARLEPLRFFPAPYEMTVFPDGRAIVKGTSDTGVARSLYARYVG
jgi:adenylyltransferase/sulfurtransferase